LDPDGTPSDIGAVFYYHIIYPAGDCNYDGDLNVMDIILVINSCILTPGNEEECVSCGDVNGDASLDVLDIVSMMVSIVGS